MSEELKLINMQEIETKEVQWLWKPYIPFGKITIVQGDPGDGKTTMILAVAAAVTKGLTLPECDAPVGIANVIYQTAEDGLGDTIKPRLVRAGANCIRVMVMIGHMNKGGFRSQYRGLGSIDIHAAARSVLTLGRIQGKPTLRAFAQGKSNLAPEGVAIAFELDPEKGFSWIGEYPVTLDELLQGVQIDRESAMERAQHLIQTELAGKELPSSTVIEMAAAQNISKRTLNAAKSALGVKSFKRYNQWHWKLS